MKTIIIVLLCLIVLGVWILGCDPVNGFDDNPIVVVGDTAYVNLAYEDRAAVFYGCGSVHVSVGVHYDGYTVEYDERWSNEIKKVVLFFEDCPPRDDDY